MFTVRWSAHSLRRGIVLTGLIVLSMQGDVAAAQQPILAFTDTERGSAWTFSGDGSTLAVGWSKTGGTKAGLIVVDLSTGKQRKFSAPRTHYLPPNVSLTRDGRYVAYTSYRRLDTKNRYGGSTIDATTHVRDLRSGTVRNVRHFKGSLGSGDGSFLVGARTPAYKNAVGQERNGGTGVLSLRSGRLATFRRAPNPTTQINPLAINLSGSRVVFQYGERGNCYVFSTADRRTTKTDEKYCSSDILLADDGSEFLSGGHPYDARSGRALSPTGELARIITDQSGRLDVVTASSDLNQLLVTCLPGYDYSKRETEDAARKRFTHFVLDRRTGTYRRLPNPAGRGEVEDPRRYYDFRRLLLTDDARMLFYADGDRIFRATTDGPQEQLPADCQPLIREPYQG